MIGTTAAHSASTPPHPEYPAQRPWSPTATPSADHAASYRRVVPLRHGTAVRYVIVGLGPHRKCQRVTLAKKAESKTNPSESDTEMRGNDTDNDPPLCTSSESRVAAHSSMLGEEWSGRPNAPCSSTECRHRAMVFVGHHSHARCGNEGKRRTQSWRFIAQFSWR